MQQKLPVCCDNCNITTAYLLHILVLEMIFAFPHQQCHTNRFCMLLPFFGTILENNELNNLSED